MKAETEQDPELSALAAVLYALIPLDDAARTRVLEYVGAWCDAQEEKTRKLNPEPPR